MLARTMFCQKFPDHIANDFVGCLKMSTNGTCACIMNWVYEICLDLDLRLFSGHLLLCAYCLAAIMGVIASFRPWEESFRIFYTSFLGISVHITLRQSTWPYIYLEYRYVA